MAKNFNQADLDEFSDCVELFAADGDNRIINTKDELQLIMRSLGYSPTVTELESYYGKNNTDGLIDFATFLDIMYEHSMKEKCQQEIMAAFIAQDSNKRGTISTQDLKNVLLNFGEKLTPKEVDSLFQEASLTSKNEVNYAKIVSTLLTPLPDYKM